MSLLHLARDRAFALILALAPVLGTSASAQAVIVVDQAGGPGANYTKLVDAVVAAEEGSLVLVRSGQFQRQIPIEGKSLFLQADEGASVGVHGLVVRDLGPSQFVAVRGIDVGCFSTTSLPQGFRITDNQGPVWLEDCSLLQVCDTRGAMVVQNSASVVLRDVTIRPSMTSGGTERPSLEVIDSTLAAYDSRFEGRSGTFTGWTGARVFDSRVTFSGCTVMGGDGSGLGFPTPPMGGVGLEITGSSGTSVVELIDTTPEGGDGIPGGTKGAGITYPAPGGTVIRSPHGVHALETSSPKSSGEAASVTLTGHPGDQMFVLFAPSPGPLVPFANAIGPLTLQPGATLLALGTLPGTGATTISVQAPVVLLGFEAIFVQVVALGTTPAPHVSLGNTTQIVVTGAEL